jgi:hypothetical protein
VIAVEADVAFKNEADRPTIPSLCHGATRIGVVHGGAQQGF